MIKISIDDLTNFMTTLNIVVPYVVSYHIWYTVTNCLHNLSHKGLSKKTLYGDDDPLASKQASTYS